MLRIVPRTLPCVGRSYDHFPKGFELQLQPGWVKGQGVTHPDRACDKFVKAHVSFVIPHTQVGSKDRASLFQVLEA